MLFPAYDIVGVYAFWRKFFVDAVLQFGQLPLWNPYQFGGTPFIANPSSGMFYPFNLLFFLFPTDFVFGYLFILDVFLIGLFTYLFARAIQLKTASAFVAAVTMMFSGTITARIIAGHVIILDTILWFPLLLLFYEKAIQTKKFLYGILAGLPIALMIIAGHTQFAVFGLVAAVMYFILRIISEKKITKNLFVTLIISLLLGFALSAVQLLPMIELSRLSGRSGGLSFAFASDFSLHPLQFLSTIFPYFFGSPLDSSFWGKGNFHELALYTGILPLVLIVIAIVLRRNKYTIIASIMAIFSLLFAFGKYAFVFPFFYHFVPFFNAFRAPGRFLFVYVFFLAILAGLGMEFLQQKKWLAKEKQLLKKLLIVISFIGGVSVLGVFLVTFFGTVTLYEKYILRNSFAVGINHRVLYEHFVSDMTLFCFFLLATVSVLWMRINNKLTRWKFASIVVLLIFSNLFLFGERFVDTKKPEEVFRTPEIIDVIKKDHGKYRVFDMTGSLISYTNRNGLETITNHDSSYVRSYRDFLWSMGPHENWLYESFIQILEIKNPSVLNVLNVKYVITDKEIPNHLFKKIYTSPKPIINYKDGRNHYILYENTGYLQRAYVVPSTVKQTIKIVTYEPNKIALDVSLGSPGQLILSEIWYPGWKVYDNGKEKIISKSHALFRSVSLSKGSHKVFFIFDPLSYKIGLVISIVSFMTLLTSLVIYVYKQLPDGRRLR